MRLNLNLLRVFHAVATENSFSGAARQLHISQPAVSKAVAELERQLGMVLLDRGNKRGRQGFVLTEAGVALNAHARAIFALEFAAVDELQQRSGLKRGLLVIGASTTIANYWLPRYLRVFTRQWPAIALKVVVANTHDITEDVLDCRLDLALVEGPVHTEGVAYYPWRKERLVMVAPPGFQGVRRTVDLSHNTWLVREEGSGTREVASGLLSMQGIIPMRTTEFGSNEGIARAVASGLGLAMLPYVVVEDLILLKRVIELRLPEMAGLSRLLYRLERRDRPASPAVEAFLEVLSRPSDQEGDDSHRQQE